MSALRPVTAILAAALLLLAGCTRQGGDTASPGATDAATTTTQETAPPSGGAGGLEDLPEVVKRVEPSVVTVLTDSGLGSGVVFDEGGWVLTNHHVVAGAQQVAIRPADASRVPATVVASDEQTDLAVLRTEADLPVPEFRTNLPEVGELVLAVGSPLGFRNSVSMGIVSGLGREVPGAAGRAPALVDLIQTDAAISPGNSGGALVDGDGRVVGINDAYIPPQAGAVSIGFAIPTATALDVARDLRDDGRVTHPFAGVLVGRLTPQVAESLDLPTSRGVLVRDVVEDGPAARAGLAAGDVVVELDGEPTETVEAFLGALRGTQPGQEVELTYLRDGEEQQVTLQLVGLER